MFFQHVNYTVVIFEELGFDFVTFLLVQCNSLVSHPCFMQNTIVILVNSAYFWPVFF